MRARKLMGLTNESHEDLVKRACTGMKKTDIVKCVNHVEKLLK